MGRKNNQSWFDKLLAGLNSIWSKIAIIGLIWYAGFEIGGLYKEAQSIKESNARDFMYNTKLNELYNESRAKEYELKKEIDNLRNERIELKARIVDLEYKLNNTEK